MDVAHIKIIMSRAIKKTTDTLIVIMGRTQSKIKGSRSEFQYKNNPAKCVKLLCFLKI
jgi:hypothetical protein